MMPWSYDITGAGIKKYKYVIYGRPSNRTSNLHRNGKSCSYPNSTGTWVLWLPLTSWSTSFRGLQSFTDPASTRTSCAGTRRPWSPCARPTTSSVRYRRVWLPRLVYSQLWGPFWRPPESDSPPQLERGTRHPRRRAPQPDLPCPEDSSNLQTWSRFWKESKKWPPSQR